MPVLFVSDFALSQVHDTVVEHADLSNEQKSIICERIGVSRTLLLYTIYNFYKSFFILSLFTCLQVTTLFQYERSHG